MGQRVHTAGHAVRSHAGRDPVLGPRDRGLGPEVLLAGVRPDLACRRDPDQVRGGREGREAGQLDALRPPLLPQYGPGTKLRNKINDKIKFSEKKLF